MNAKLPLANATRRLCVRTHAGHTCAHANLDISEMGGIVQVPSIVSKAFIFLLTSTYSFCLVGCLFVDVHFSYVASHAFILQNR